MEPSFVSTTRSATSITSKVSPPTQNQTLNVIAPITRPPSNLHPKKSIAFGGRPEPLGADSSPYTATIWGVQEEASGQNQEPAEESSEIYESGIPEPASGNPSGEIVKPQILNANDFNLSPFKLLNSMINLKMVKFADPKYFDEDLRTIISQFCEKEDACKGDKKALALLLVKTYLIANMIFGNIESLPLGNNSINFTALSSLKEMKASEITLDPNGTTYDFMKLMNHLKGLPFSLTHDAVEEVTRRQSSQQSVKPKAPTPSTPPNPSVFQAMIGWKDPVTESQPPNSSNSVNPVTPSQEKVLRPQRLADFPVSLSVSHGEFPDDPRSHLSSTSILSSKPPADPNQAKVVNSISGSKWNLSTKPWEPNPLLLQQSSPEIVSQKEPRPRHSSHILPQQPGTVAPREALVPNWQLSSTLGPRSSITLQQPSPSETLHRSAVMQQSSALHLSALFSPPPNPSTIVPEQRSNQTVNQSNLRHSQ